MIFKAKERETESDQILNHDALNEVTETKQSDYICDETDLWDKAFVFFLYIYLKKARFFLE